MFASSYKDQRIIISKSWQQDKQRQRKAKYWQTCDDQTYLNLHSRKLLQCFGNDDYKIIQTTVEIVYDYFSCLDQKQ